MLKRNESLQAVRKNWAGNRIVRGKYVNLKRKPSAIKRIDKWRIPLYKERSIINYGKNWRADVIEIESVHAIAANSLVWLGHNSFIINLGGVNIILDPVFGHIPFVRRKSKMPINPDKVDHIDILLLSHDHYDHTDKSSVKLLAKLNHGMEVAAGLGLKSLLHRWVPHLKVSEMGWYQKIEIKGIKISFLPCQHWGKRNVADGATRLWGAFMIEYNGKKIYYSGDTGFSNHFDEVFQLYGQVDYALIGIGAYKPRWFMERNHISPREAIEAARVMRAKVAIPMHYGTFKLSREPLFDPPLVFKYEAVRAGVNTIIPKIGEVVPLNL